MLEVRATWRTITPEHLPIALGGYTQGERASSIASPLEVNCVALTDGVKIAVIVSVDLLYVTHALRKAVLAGVADAGVDDSSLFMAASHTHYAPAIDETKPSLGTPEIGFRDQMLNTIVEAIRDAVLGLKSAVVLASASGYAATGVNRRKRRVVRIGRGGVEVNKTAMRPNPSGSTDPVVSVLALRDGERTLAYVWSGACHPTGLAEGDTISAHWPGDVRDELRRVERAGHAGNEHVPVLFLQGFSGDVRPPSGRPKGGHAKTLVRRILSGPTFEPLDPAEYSRWAGSAASRIARLARDCLPRAANASVSCARFELPASQFASDADHLPPVSFHRITIGGVTLVGASAELVSGYAAHVRAMAPDMHVIPVGCIDHVIGYWPTQQMFEEGGYEVVGYCPSFGISACSPDIEEKALEQFARLLSGV